MSTNTFRDANSPNGLFVGLRAMTTQNYTEANVKNGAQHESSVIATLAGSASYDTIFKTGAHPVALKSRTIGYTGDGVSALIYVDPVYTGGTVTPYYNPNNMTQVTGLSTITLGTTVTDVGTQAFASEHLLGSTSHQSKGIAARDLGQERILKPDTTYLFRLTSLDAQQQQVSSYLSWYEGLLDLPLP